MIDKTQTLPARTSPLTVITAAAFRLGPDLHLGGSLNYAGFDPVPFELVLRRDGQQLRGLVRYLSSDGKRVAAHTLAGELNERSVELREVDRIWTLTPATPESRLAERDFGRVFVFELPLPSPYPQPAEITGHWFRGDITGSFSLRPASPW